MSNPKDPQVLDHDYDGIQEYDNPLPNWWLITFFGTVVFAFHYYLHYEVAGGPTLTEELKASMKKIEQMAGSAPRGPVETEEALAVVMSKPENVSKGKEVYTIRCASCHGAEGQGLIGPNLTDKFWIHGRGSRVEILDVIRKGVVEKGMPNWETMLKPEEVISVGSFVYGLKGTNPTNPKPPQGSEVQ